MSEEGRIRELLTQARYVLEEESDAEEFLARSTPYLDAFDQWQNTFSPEVLSQHPELRRELNQLSAVHQQILDRGRALSTEVLQQIGDTNKRGSVLRTYLDRLPSRVTITGKREG